MITEHGPYVLPQKEKEARLLKELNKLVEHHQAKCSPYARLIKLFWPKKQPYSRLTDVPYLPVNLFKTQDLKSIPNEEVFKILRSSGTTSLHPSKIYLSKEAAQRQTEALAEVITSFIGPKRLPMLVFDHPDVIKNLAHYSARGAALVGMLTFGRDIHYAFTSDGQINVELIKEWASRHLEEPVLLFGLTSFVYESLEKLALTPLSLPNGILIHSGGWKKLTERAVTNAQFKDKLAAVLGVKRCHNFYGMVEQIGSVFMECEAGYFHAPSFADVIVRNTRTWSEAEIGETGVIEVLSCLPDSYPGQALLTEDLGKIVGSDDCPCGRKGKYFVVEGRVPQAEIRGCSDTYSFGAAT